MVETFRDAFIIHSKSDPVEAALASHLFDWLQRVGIDAYEYSEWQWATNRPGKIRYSSSGTYVDPIRWALRHPEPFEHQTREDVPDRDTLTEMLANCRVVVFIGPRSGSPTTGVDVEREVLPRDPAVVLASWGNHTDWLSEIGPAFVYHIANPYDQQQSRAALDLAHLGWLHWVFDCFARDGGKAGQLLLVELANREPRIRRSLRTASRIAKRVGKDLAGEPTNPESLDAALVQLVGSLSADEIRPVVRIWWGRASFRSALPLAPDPDIAGLIEFVSNACHLFSEAALRRYPTLVEIKAEALRLRAAHATAIGEPGTALEYLGQAVNLPRLSATGRSSVLADRAALTTRTAPSSADADVESVLKLRGAAPGATIQALYLRARRHISQGNSSDAMRDLSAAVRKPADVPVLQALCLHDRAMLFAQRGEYAKAVQDLDTAVAIRSLPPEILGPALLDRGVSYGELGDADAEVRDYTRVIELDGPPELTRLKALMYRGMTRMSRGDKLGAIKDFVAVRDDPSAPPDARKVAESKLDELSPLPRSVRPSAET